jgi:hypothetical protein
MTKQIALPLALTGALGLSLLAAAFSRPAPIAEGAGPVPDESYLQVKAATPHPSTNDPWNPQAEQADIEKMKALVQQLQTNLGFVTPTQGPLKHQFELEIEMWQLEIARMERQKGNTSQRK